MKKILLTTTSFQDTPGSHHDLLNKQNFEVVKLRGPIKENKLLEIIQDFDGVICGDDEFTDEVIKKGSLSKLKVISKYGIGIDSIDTSAANKYKVRVTNCPGINQISVAEHAFALMLTYFKNIVKENHFIQNNEWVRLISNDLSGKKIGILGLGAVGKQFALRAKAFDMDVCVFDVNIDLDFVKKNNISYENNIDEILFNSDILSLHLPLTDETHHLVNLSNFNKFKKGVVIINTARAKLVDQNAILKGINDTYIGGYLTDVLEEEPMITNHPFLNNDKIIITPHIASRTYENVEKQAIMSIENLLKHI